MRQVFRSQRLENVETAARLLRDAGIEVKIENGRSWRGHRRGNFSYDLRQARDPATLPTLWVVRAEDQPHAREILRRLGLLETTRATGTEALQADRFRFQPGSGSDRPGNWRLRVGLVILIAITIGLIVFLPRRKAAPPPAPAAVKVTPALVPEAITDPGIFRLDVPSALAAKLASTVLANSGGSAACLRVDGKAPSPKVLQQIRAGAEALQPPAACGAPGVLQVRIGNYLTDGSGSGTVEMTVAGKRRTLRVFRDGAVWHIEGDADPRPRDEDATN